MDGCLYSCVQRQFFVHILISYYPTQPHRSQTNSLSRSGHRLQWTYGDNRESLLLCAIFKLVSTKVCWIDLSTEQHNSTVSWVENVPIKIYHPLELHQTISSSLGSWHFHFLDKEQPPPPPSAKKQWHTEPLYLSSMKYIYVGGKLQLTASYVSLIMGPVKRDTQGKSDSGCLHWWMFRKRLIERFLIRRIFNTSFSGAVKCKVYRDRAHFHNVSDQRTFSETLCLTFSSYYFIALCYLMSSETNRSWAANGAETVSHLICEK